MEETRRATTEEIIPYFNIGQDFLHFITSEFASGKKPRINRMRVLMYMIDNAAKLDGWWFHGKLMRKGESFISRIKVADALNMTENEAKGAIDWLKVYGHIRKNDFKKVDNKLGTAYFVTGLTNPEYYKTTRHQESENVDITGENADVIPLKSPGTSQKSPSENNEIGEESSMFSESDGTENHRNNIRVPIESSVNSDYYNNRSPEKRVSCDFGAYKSLDDLKKFIERHTQRSKYERNKYNCPFCGSGAGKHGTGALSIDKDRVKAHCFSGGCGFDGDIYDFAGRIYQTDDKIEQYKIVSAFFDKP